MFSLASKLLSTIATPAFEKAYEKGCSIWEAKDELRKLQKSIQTIKAVLLDAEKKQETSAAVKDWVERLKDVLYDADDLFDEVATDQMLKQQIIKEDKLFKKVRASCSKLNPIVSRNSIANRVKDTRKRLLEISTDMAGFNFVTIQPEEPISGVRQERDPGSFVDSKDVVGRDEDKKVIFEFLLGDKSNQDVSIIAIVGIGGMGKTTLAQLVYNDEEVMKNFENRWFACISDTSNDKEVIGEVFQSICDKKYGDFTLSQLQTEIRKSVKGVKFLLVLDDVWDDDHGRWIKRMRLLNGGAKGSKIVVTTRSQSVARAVGALEAHKLEGLSENESWDLFKSVAFTPEQEKNPVWVQLGREIVKKCANVPLAIRSVGSLLYTKDTIEEWKSFIDIELSKVELSGDDSVMQTLKLSYDHLPVNLKPCFAYCSLLPKDHVFDRDELIYLWIAQGYIKPMHELETVEQAGYSYFMDLHRRSFFEKNEDFGFYTINRKEYKMHDLIHDLAQCVAGEEFTALTKTTTQLNKRARHVSIGPDVDTSHILDTNRLRSLLFLHRQVEYEDRQFAYKKCLRALSLSGLRIHTVSSCIGELKHLRYLNLSGNRFESLPDSLTNLLNLLTLDIKWCKELKALPDSFRKLINLRHLNIDTCSKLTHMPPGMGELTCLQKLSDFKVGKAIEGVQRSGLDELAGLQLRGDMLIGFDNIDNWDGDECWKLPVSLEYLSIYCYPGRRIPHWSNHPSFIPNLARLTLFECPKVKYLPPLRCLPNLKSLHLKELEELEYIEEEEVDPECITVAAGYITNNSLFFPLLEQLTMVELRKLKGWSRKKVEATTTSSATSASHDLSLSFPLLSELMILICEELSSIPLCPYVRRLHIKKVDYGLLQQWVSTTTSPSSVKNLVILDCQGLVSFPAEALSSLKECFIQGCHSLENLSLLVSPFLKDLKISLCNGLTSVEVEALPSLASLKIEYCEQLKSLRIARLNALWEFKMWGCPKELELWGIQQEKRCVDWDSLPNLRVIRIEELPSPEELPDCLRHQQALGQLQILQC